MPTSTIVTYTRGTTYIENAYTDDGKTATAHALVGTLVVHGQSFDAVERMDGYVKMKAGTWANSSMYVDAKRGKVLNPWLGKTSEANAPPVRSTLATVLTVSADPIWKI